MGQLRDRIEEGFALWAGLLVRGRWVALFLVLAATGLLATRLPLLEVETSSEDYLFDDDPAKIAYDAFRDQFGRDQAIYVVVEPPEVFDLAFLDWLGAFHARLEEEVPHLDDVLSLVNVRSVHAIGDELRVDELLENPPENEAQLVELKKRVLSTPSYLDNVISVDGRVTALHVTSYAYSYEEPESVDALGVLDGFDEAAQSRPPSLLSASENAAFSRAVLDVVDRYRRDDYTIHVTGQPLVAYALTRSMAQDMPRIFGGALAIVGLMIVVLFRRVSPLLISAVVVVLALISTLGIAQLLGFPISLPTQILPSFLLALGVGYVVHLLTIYFRELPAGRAVALERALRHVGLPILMTAVTTIAGLVSFVAASMEQAYQLGISGAVGVAVTVVYTLVFVPALLVLLPLRPKRRAARWDPVGVLLDYCAYISTRHPRKIVGAVGVLALGTAFLLPRLDYSADPMAYFPEEHWLRVSTFFADERLGGMQSLEIVVDTGRENGLLELEVLERIEAMHALVPALQAEGERVTRAWSLLDVLKETHQALHENRPEAYRIAQDPELVAQEFLLYEQGGADDLEDLVDTQLSKARVSILAGWEDGVEKQRFIERAGGRFVETMGDEAEVQLTGAVAMIARTASASAESLIKSYALALMLITPLMVVLIGSARAGLVSMVPNLVPIGAALALMVVVGIELDLFTILGACIAIGLAVDDSIHFISGFRRQLAQTGDPVRAVERTMASTGRALFFTSLVLVAGFGVLGLSSMANLGYLGATTAFAIGLAFVLDVTATPALLVLTHQKPASRRR